ncbi:hypothetical protein IA57_00865 [Mangrovimonas yunxiaonensis]|uniref:DUF4252 domain-containing protein n=1 Tax=Mangrovimonas yunxiaonensis TaxID=1197477 RepID=A0A084TND3_9FLAO|nr:DUF4252 domain-containing protein [Mangrovimonas yunxiaonensis]KFB02219.1 hypothetical protein IA57_00865 [Mangrovimonas yunxiaonensis]
MKQSIKKHLYGLLACLMLVSCNNQETLQTYFVDRQETPNFTSADLPTSIVSLEETLLTDDQKDAYQSIKRLNFLGYKIKDTSNLADFNAEVSKVKNILNGSNYNDLMEFNSHGGKVVVKYLGDDEKVDEFIVFGNSKDMGFGIVRVLGDDMSPAKIMALTEALKNADIDEDQLKGLTNFFVGE